jgi:hypothetical protein
LCDELGTIDAKTKRKEGHMTKIQRFTVYRPNIESSEKHELEHRNGNDEAQYEGVIWSDGTVTLRWLTPLASTSVWPNIETALGVHGHPEYGTEIVWHDGAAPLYWVKKVSDYYQNLMQSNGD